MRVSQILFLAAVFSLPIQLGKFFWPEHSFVYGIPVDYLASSIYFSDLVLVAYLAVFLLENFKNLKKIYSKRKIPILFLLFFNLYMFTNAVFVSKAITLSLWSSLKLAEFSIFFLFASWSLLSKKVYRLSLIVIGISLLWQSMLVIPQFVLQRSLGLWVLGERSFDSSTVGIAHIQVFGRQILRPYGTFSHPNVVGAYLVIGLVIVSSLFSVFKKVKGWFFILLLAIFAVFITFSKGAILAMSASVIVVAKKTRFFFLTIALLTVLIWFSLGSILQFQIASISERLMLSEAAFDIATLNPLFGVGNGRFIVELSELNLYTVSEVRLLQPVHNVFLLVLAESGIIGLLLFALVMLSVFKVAKSKIQFALIVAILVFLSVDHFFWTINQGRFLFWLTLSYILVSPNDVTS